MKLKLKGIWHKRTNDKTACYLRLKTGWMKNSVVVTIVDNTGERISQGNLCEISTNGIFHNKYITTETDIETNGGKISII